MMCHRGSAGAMQGGRVVHGFFHWYKPASLISQAQCARRAHLHHDKTQPSYRRFAFSYYAHFVDRSHTKSTLLVHLDASS